MQAKKAKQLLKARLCRERQLYEMRKRAELKAAISELERPWEVVERAPNLFSVSADEQVKALADRFQRPGGFAGQFFKTAHAVFVATALADPDGQRRSPIASAAQGPVHQIVQPVAVAAVLDVGRMPVNLLVLLDQAVLELGVGDEPAVGCVVAKRRGATPASVEVRPQPARHLLQADAAAHRIILELVLPDPRDAEIDE